MPFRADRRPRRHDPFLQHKTLLFALGAGCAFAGMLFDADWLVSVGIVVLGSGVVLRLIGERRRDRAEKEDDEGVDDSGGHGGASGAGSDARSEADDPSGGGAGEDRDQPPR
jgi:hypothetical protein